MTETTIDLHRRGLSPAATCRHKGWDVGTHLVGDEGHGPTVIRITAVGESNVLAVEVSHNGRPTDGAYEHTWTLGCRDWTEVTP